MLRTEKLTRSFGRRLAVNAVDFEVRAGGFEPKNHNPISDIHMRTVQANPLRHVVTDVLKDVRHPDSGACVL